MRHRLRAARDQVRAGLRLAALMRRPIRSVHGFEDEVRERLRRREDNFLWSVEHLMFGHPGSPYRPLFEVAGYALPRVRQLVRTHGLHAALDRLREDGVYVRVQEFKGGEPVVRHGRTFGFSERDFDNPAVRALVHTRSSGSRSQGTVTGISEDDFLFNVRHRIWLHEGYGLGDRDVILLTTPGSGVHLVTAYAVAGRPPLAWFSPVPHGGQGRPLLLRVAQAASGVRLPPLRVVPPDRVVEVARFIARVNTPRGIVVHGFVNSAVRLVLAAEEAGIRLGRVAFRIGGEPITPAKRRHLESRGFEVFAAFSFSELGRSAVACPIGHEADDMHVLTDKIAVRRYERPLADGQTVPAYLFTSLLPHARHVMLNVESGDYGGLEERSCGCFLDRAGLRLHLHTVRSFEKLTAEGITFIGPSLIELLEDVLPRECGGDPRHYQLVEAEDERGFTRLYLLVSPDLGPLDEAAVRRLVLRELGQRSMHRGYGRTIETAWSQAGTVQVLRRQPLQTATGKVLHLHRDRGALAAETGSAVR